MSRRADPKPAPTPLPLFQMLPPQPKDEWDARSGSPPLMEMGPFNSRARTWRLGQLFRYQLAAGQVHPHCLPCRPCRGPRTHGTRRRERPRALGIWRASNAAMQQEADGGQVQRGAGYGVQAEKGLGVSTFRVVAFPTTASGVLQTA